MICTFSSSYLNFICDDAFGILHGCGNEVSSSLHSELSSAFTIFVASFSLVSFSPTSFSLVAFPLVFKLGSSNRAMNSGAVLSAKHRSSHSQMCKPSNLPRGIIVQARKQSLRQSSLACLFSKVAPFFLSSEFELPPRTLSFRVRELL